MVRELESYLKLVRRVRKRNANVSWADTHSRWYSLIAELKAREDEIAKTGVAHHAPTRLAGNLAIEISETLESDRILDLVAATWMLQLFHPERFNGRNDDTFWFALGTIVRRDAKVGRAWHYREGRRTLTSYRELAKSTRLTLARHLTHGFGLASITIAQLEHKRLTAKADAETKFKAAVASIA
jgi:hypothetical protein